MPTLNQQELEDVIDTTGVVESLELTYPVSSKDAEMNTERMMYY